MNARQVLFVSFALSGVLIFAWQDRRQELAALQEDWNASFGDSTPGTSSTKESWWSMYFPALPVDDRSSQATRAQVEQAVSGWSEFTHEELAEVVAREAGRWIQSPAAPLADATWQAREETAAYAVMSFSGSGSDADALAWLQHLLASPSGSEAYLVDPARIDLIAIEPSGLRLEAEFRIWPHSAFLGQSIAGGAQ